MTQRYPSKFFAPTPALWQFAFWGGFGLLSIASAVSMLTANKPNFSGLFVMLGCLAGFTGFGVSTWIERQRSRKPALEITETEIVFWRGSSRQSKMPWDQLQKVWVSEGSNPHIIFEPRDLRKYGRRTIFIVRAGPSVPLNTAAEDGTRLEAVIAHILDEHRTEPSL